MIRRLALIGPLLSLVACGGPDRAPATNTAQGKAPVGQMAMTDEHGQGFVVDRSHKGRAAPAVAFTAAGGRPTSLAAMAGKPVLLNLWATWCAPCIKEMPALDRLAASNKAISVVALSQDLDGAGAVDPFFAKQGIGALRPFYDTENAVLTALGMQGLPMTVLYDAGGKEVWRVQGALDWSGPTAARLIAEAG